MNQLKKILKVAIPLLLSAVLVWALFRNQDLSKIFSDIKGADFSWIFLSYVASMISHTARASRWRQLYVPIGYKPSTFRVLLAIMFGYFMNIFIPRAGELSRAELIRRTDKIPFEVSIGTVVAERAFDVLTILVLILAALSINYELFAKIYEASLAQVPQGEEPKGPSYGVYIVLGIIVLLVGGAYAWTRIAGKRFLAKLRSFFRNVWKGVKSIRYVKNKPLFIFNTVVIWGMYFFMSYLVFFSIPATSGLGWEVGLTVLVMSGIAMLVPVQGGIGAYHLFISTTLVFFDLTRDDALVYATLMHASQLLLYFVGGGICFLIGIYLAGRRNQQS